MTTIQALALDYVLAIYHLALLGVVFFFAELHDRGCKLTLWLWNPSTGMWTIELMAKINLAHISQQGTQLIICPYQQQPAQVGHALLILPASNSPWLQH